MRSILYDTVSDRYPRFLRNELFPEIETKYNIPRIHTVARLWGCHRERFQLQRGVADAGAVQPSDFLDWQLRQFQWKENPANADGGQDYPDKVFANLREMFASGCRMEPDMQYAGAQRNYGNWPAANLRMANALKVVGYDFHFSFGEGSQRSTGSVELPEELAWLWRDYDSAKIQQDYEQSPDERAKPPFRFKR